VVDQLGFRPDQLVHRGESSLNPVATLSEREGLGVCTDSVVSSSNTFATPLESIAPLQTQGGA
jgi:hypothetical protein